MANQDHVSALIKVELLSSREREVVTLATHGHTDEQIAQRLGIRLGTVHLLGEDPGEGRPTYPDGDRRGIC